jgi:hypothetical protein
LSKVIWRDLPGFARTACASDGVQHGKRETMDIQMVSATALETSVFSRPRRAEPGQGYHSQSADAARTALASSARGKELVRAWCFANSPIELRETECLLGIAARTEPELRRMGRPARRTRPSERAIVACYRHDEVFDIPGRRDANRPQGRLGRTDQEAIETVTLRRQEARRPLCSAAAF